MRAIRKLPAIANTVPAWRLHHSEPAARGWSAASTGESSTAGNSRFQAWASRNASAQRRQPPGSRSNCAQQAAHGPLRSTPPSTSRSNRRSSLAAMFVPSIWFHSNITVPYTFGFCLGNFQGGQLRPQPSAGAVQSRLDGTLAQPQVLGQLPVTPILRVLQQEQFRIALRNAGQGPADLSAPLLGQQPTQRIGLAVALRGPPPLGVAIDQFPATSRLAAMQQGTGSPPGDTATAPPFPHPPAAHAAGP